VARDASDLTHQDLYSQWQSIGDAMYLVRDLAKPEPKAVRHIFAAK